MNPLTQAMSVKLLDQAHDSDLRLTFSIASTANNANSRLLRLPQELRTLIYESVLGGQLIHIHIYVAETSVSHYLCQAKISEMEAHNFFAAAKGSWFSADTIDRHHTCYGMSLINRSCFQCPNNVGPSTEPPAGLDVALLRCCRQTYHETRLLAFSANTLSFKNPWDFQIFCSFRIFGTNPPIPVDTKFVVRRLHLDIIIRDDYDENGWNAAFRKLARNLKNLQYLYIDIEQRPSGNSHFKKWQFEEPAGSSFLVGLRELRGLRLKIVTVIIADNHILHTTRENLKAEKERRYRWTMAQKQEWADHIRRVLLRVEDKKPVAGEES